MIGIIDSPMFVHTVIVHGYFSIDNVRNEGFCIKTALRVNVTLKSINAHQYTVCTIMNKI